MGIYQIAILREYFKLKTEELKNLFFLMEESINKSEKDYKQRCEKSLRDSPKEYKSKLEEIIADDFAIFSLYKQILYNSFLIIIFIFLESALNAICRNIEKIKKNGSKIELNDIRRNKGIIERDKIYLNKIGGYPNSFFETKDWQEIKMLQEIRNALVHNDGRIPEGNKGDKLKKYLKDNPGFFSYIDLDTTEFSVPILVKRNYCLATLRHIDGFLEQLLTNKIGVGNDVKQ